MNKRTSSILNTLLFLGLILCGGYVTMLFLEGKPYLTEDLLVKLKPFFVYIFLSAVAYGGLIYYNIKKKEQLFISAHLSPICIGLLFIISVWLLHTTLFYVAIPGAPHRVIPEPTPQTLVGAHEETVAVLQENFLDLKNAGCFREVKNKSIQGESAYRYSSFCMQKSFFSRVLPPLGILLFIIFNFLVLGRFLLRICKLQIKSSLIESVVSLGLGSAGIMFLLWLLALFHSLKTFPAWVLLLAIPAIFYRDSVHFARVLWKKKWEVKIAFHSSGLLLFWLLISLLALNYLTVIRAFPIGWDALGRYINFPRQMSLYGFIIPGMFNAQWEYLTSLGFILFGYTSAFSATLAQTINWMSGAFAVFAIYVCTRLILGERSGLLAGLFYYSLPMVGHFSFMDMKTENALLFFGTVGVICVFEFLRDRHRTQDTGHRSILWWLFIAGIMLAAGFATKPTIIILAFVAGIILTFAMIGKVSGFGSVIISLAILAKFGALSLYAITERLFGRLIEEAHWTGVPIVFVIGVLILLFPFIYPRLRLTRLRPYLLATLALVSGFLFFSAPWMVRNVALSGSIDPLITTSTLKPLIVYSETELTDNAPSNSRALPKELAIDPKHSACVGTVREEELDRYWGEEKGIMHYLKIPWDTALNLHQKGYYITLSPLLIILPFLVLFPAFWKKKYLRLMFFGTVFYVAVWTFAGNGIPWYGIGMFLGLSIAVDALVQCAPDRKTRTASWILIAIALIFSFSARLDLFSMQHGGLVYGWGEESVASRHEVNIPDYDDIAEAAFNLSKNPEYPFLYRIGTSISYFVPGNLELIPMHDNQLGFFNCINQERDHSLTLKRIRALGFHSIVFDTETASIEADPNGTLHAKERAFLDFVNDSTIGIRRAVYSPERGIAYYILP